MYTNALVMLKVPEDAEAQRVDLRQGGSDVGKVGGRGLGGCLGKGLQLGTGNQPNYGGIDHGFALRKRKCEVTWRRVGYSDLHQISQCQRLFLMNEKRWPTLT